MKKFIQKVIKEKIANNDTPVMSFRIPEFNGKCVKCSSLLQTCINKLQKLGVEKFHFEIEEFKDFI